MLQLMSVLLKPKELIFCSEYLSGVSAAEAWTRAGYSARSARTEGPKALRRPAIQTYLASKQRLEEAKTEALQDRVIKELERMAFANIEDFTRLEDDGQRDVDFSKATREQLSAVTKIRNKTRRIYNNKGEHIATEVDQSFDLADKYRGLELLGRHLGLYREAEQRVVIDVADRLLNARKRMLRLTARVDDDAESPE